VTGSAFQIVDDRYLIYLSLDGELRAAPYDGRAALVGRSVSLVAGIRRDAVGSGQMDVTPGGLLGYIPARSNADVQLVVLHAGGEAKPLPIERAYFQRFELTRDGRRLAAVVVTPEGNELRIYDLRTGQHQTWLRAEYIGGPLWDRAGERILVRVRNPGRTAIIRGSPSLATAPDTLMAAADPTRIPEPTDYHDDANVLARGVAPYALMRLDLTRQPVRADTFFPDAVFAAISPDGRHLVWQSQSQAQLDLSSYPPGAARQQIAVGGVEPLWLSSSELLYRAGLTWNVVRLDPATGALAGAPTRWGLDTRFLDTPGWSNRPSGDGGIVYVQSPDISDARFLRFMPDFVTRMEAAVDAANR
jgi:hypothetical protein